MAFLLSQIVTVVLIGAGQRGADVYGDYIKNNSDKIRLVAVAEPDNHRRSRVSQTHTIEESRQFTTWNELFELGKIADAAIIATPDTLHFEPAKKAIELGYDVLLEKPMATQLDHIQLLLNMAKQRGILLKIAHVLRYTDYFSLIKRVIDSKVVGDLVNISWRENVSYYHYAHSFIRGNWRNTQTSSPMILAKCSHDLDLIQWFVNSPVKTISSFGSQTYFGQKNKPEGSPDRCIEGCPVEDTCLFYAPRLYKDIIPLLHIGRKSGPIGERIVSKMVLKFPAMKKLPVFNQVETYSGLPVSVITEERDENGKITPEMKLRALQDESNDYGRCVYAIEEHDIVDHQTVNIEFENGVTANLIMHGFSPEEGRSLRLDFTRGKLVGEFKVIGSKLKVLDTMTNKVILRRSFPRSDAHGGGDVGIMEEFVNTLSQNMKASKTSIDQSVESHLMAFAAERSRLENRHVSMSEMRD